MKNTRAEKPLPKNRPSKRVGSGTLVSPLSPSRSRIDQAKRYALQNFDQWNEVTGFVQPHCGYYGEITSLIRDAVEFGFGVAHGQTWRAIRRRLKAEEDAETKACVIEAGANAAGQTRPAEPL